MRRMPFILYMDVRVRVCLKGLVLPHYDLWHTLDV